MRGHVPHHQLHGATPAEHVRGELGGAEQTLQQLEALLGVLSMEIGDLHARMEDRSGPFIDLDENSPDADRAIRRMRRSVRDIRRILTTWTQTTHDPRFGAS